jgi:hypothetical protein
MHPRRALYHFYYELVVGWCRHAPLSLLLLRCCLIFSVLSHAFLILFPSLTLEHDSKIGDGAVFFFYRLHAFQKRGVLFVFLVFCSGSSPWASSGTHHVMHLGGCCHLYHILAP